MRSDHHLLIVHDFPPLAGGQSAYLENLARAFPSGQVTVLAPCLKGDRAADRAQPFRVVRRPYLVPLPILERPLKALLSFFWALPMVLLHRPRFLHGAHVLSTAVAAWALSRLTGVPYIVYTHSADILQFEKTFFISWLQGRVLAGAFRVYANSRFTCGHLERLGVPAEKIRLLPPRIDPLSVANPPLAASLLRELGLEGRRIILSVNRLVPRKGNDTMIRAFTRIAAEEPQARYVIFGEGPAGAGLRELCDSLGMGPFVLFVRGDAALRNALLNACEVFVMVSRDIPEQGDYEGFGIVYLEAGACARPVVAGDCGGVRDAVEDGVNGLLVPPADVDAVADAVIRLLEDPLLARRLGRQGQERVLEKFNACLPVSEIRDLVEP